MSSKRMKIEMFKVTLLLALAVCPESKEKRVLETFHLDEWKGLDSAMNQFWDHVLLDFGNNPEILDEVCTQIYEFPLPHIKLLMEELV